MLNAKYQILNPDPAVLYLADGTIYHGSAIGWSGTAAGEVVFNTSHTGYQEMITDPSYHGQILAFCHPQIGNYGITKGESESSKAWVSGVIIKKLSSGFSNYSAYCSLEEFLIKEKIVGIQGLDTRSLVKRIRTAGALPGVISSEIFDPGELKAVLENMKDIGSYDLTREINDSGYSGYQTWKASPGGGKLPLAVVVDYGVKNSILTSLESAGFMVKVVPGSAVYEDLAALSPAAVVLSNGPGNPEKVQSGIELARALISENSKKRIPVLGICLGHQLLCLGSGASTYKLPFGHHGANHPVKDLRTGKVEITSQNHNYCLKKDGPGNGFEVTHINLSDNTAEGIAHREYPISGIQYHPEAAPGPHDSAYIFSELRNKADA